MLHLPHISDYDAISCFKSVFDIKLSHVTECESVFDDS